MVQHVERRRIQRIETHHTIGARVGARRAVVLDVSVTGVRIAHEESIGRVGDSSIIEIEWEGQRIVLRCEIKRTQIQRTTQTTVRTVYHSGLQIVEAANDSAVALRRYVEHQVRRALDEQKANAHGIPPLAPLSSTPRIPTDLVRHELTPTGWKARSTTEFQQPATGFTISAEHTTREIQMLRLAFEKGVTDGTRDLIRRLAQLSITPTEAISVRKYVP